MDPSKSPSAPPQNWTAEKSSMGHVPPPPYQDHPYPGYPQQGYPAPPHYGDAAYGQQSFPMDQQQQQQLYPGQPATVTVQPTYLTPAPLTEPVNDYLCYSIFTMLCCCLPLGIAALIYSILARESNHLGDQLGAERSSRMARTLNHVALGLGIGVFILTIVYIVVMWSLINN